MLNQISIAAGMQKLIGQRVSDILRNVAAFNPGEVALLAKSFSELTKAIYPSTNYTALMQNVGANRNNNEPLPWSDDY